MLLSESSSSSSVFVHFSALFLLLAARCTNCQDCDANPNLPICKFRRSSSQKKECDSFYLIPGKANECGRKLGNKYLSIDSSTVSVTGQNADEIIKLPGCFTVQFNVEVLPAAKLDKSFLANVHFDWLNLKEFSDLPCKNQSSNGCGGYGNNCYYCDICNSLKQLKTDVKVQKSNLAKQFSDIDCPDKQGIYLLKKEFCFKDFHDLDKNDNCKIDALESAEGQQYKKALENLQQSGFGTVVAKFTLAQNATIVQQADKAAKEREIEKESVNELEAKKKNSDWDVNKLQYEQFKAWFVQQRIDMYYKNEFLPRLLTENEVACLAVSFTVCDKKPIKQGDQLICPPKNSIFLNAFF